MALISSSVNTAIGYYSGFAFLFLFGVAAVCWGWARASGNISLVLPLSHLWVHKHLYTPHKALFSKGEFDVLWVSHLVSLLLWLGTTGLPVMLIVMACYVPSKYAGASLFFVGVCIFVLASNIANGAANSWEPLSTFHGLYHWLGVVSFAGFLITQVIYLTLNPTYRGTGALYIALSCVPLVLLEQKGRKAHRSQSALQDEGEQRLYTFLLDRTTLIDNLVAPKHAFKARKSMKRVVEKYKDVIRLWIGVEEADRYLKDRLGVGVQFWFWWLVSFVPYIVWTARMVDAGSDANASAAPLVFAATFVNELCLLPLDIEWNYMALIFVIGRFVVVLSGSLYWLIGLTAVSLLSSTLITAAMLRRALFQHEDSVAAFGSIVASILDETSKEGGKASPPIDPSQISVVTVDKAAATTTTTTTSSPAPTLLGPLRLRDIVELCCLLSLQASIGAAIIVSYKAPLGITVTYLSGASQGGWAGVVWLAWAFAMGAVLLLMLLRRGSKGGGKGLLEEYTAAVGQLASSLARLSDRGGEGSSIGAAAAAGGSEPEPSVAQTQSREQSLLLAGVAMATYLLLLGTGVLASYLVTNWAILVCLLVLPPAFSLWAYFASRWETRGTLAPQVAFCGAYLQEVGGACPDSALLCCSALPASALADTPWPSVTLVIVNALICIPLDYNYTVMYLCLWLLGIMAIHACCIMWRTTVELSLTLYALVACALAPVVVWAIVSGVTGDQSFSTVGIVMLFFAGIAVQLMTLSLAVYYDYFQLERNKPEPVIAAAAQEQTRVSRVWAALLRAVSLCDPTLALVKISLLASEACALVTAAIFARYENVYLGIAMVICLALSLLAAGALLAEGPQRAARALRAHKYEIAALSVLFLACCGLFGAIADSGITNKYLWVSLSWLCLALLFLGAGAETELLEDRACDSVSFFPVYRSAADGGVQDVSLRAGGVLVSLAMTGLWGVWSSVVLTPSDIGVIIYVTSLLIAVLYLKRQRANTSLAVISLADGDSCGGGDVLVAACKEALSSLGGDGGRPSGVRDGAAAAVTALDLIENIRRASLDRDEALRSLWKQDKGAADGMRRLLHPVPFYVPIRRAIEKCRSQCNRAGHADLEQQQMQAEREHEHAAVLDCCRDIEIEAAVALDRCASLRSFHASFRLSALKMSTARRAAKYAEIIDFLRRRDTTDKLVGDAGMDSRELSVGDLERLPPRQLAEILRAFAAYDSALAQRRTVAEAEDRAAKEAEKKREEERRRAAAEALVAQRAEEERRRAADEAKEAMRKARDEAEERRRSEERARQEEEMDRLRKEAAALAEGQEKQRREQELQQKQREADAARQRQELEEQEHQRQLAAEAVLAAAQPAVDPLVGRYGAASAMSLAAIIRECAQQSGPFTDRDFSGMQQMGSKELESRVGALKRLVEVNPALPGQVDQHALPKKSVSVEDIKQGQLGDCYYLSGLATMCIRPGLISQMFVHADPQKGLYAVRLFHNGSFKTVVLDDVVPTNHGRPIFASGVESSGSALWVVLLEKAYAKLHGSYANIEGGFVSQAISDCTGGVPGNIELGNTSEMPRNWTELVSLFRNGHLLGAGSTAGKDTDISSLGIVQGHAYSILDVQEVDGHQLLRARNPWGQREWTGRWSDKSAEWTPRMKKLLAYKDADDGSFWICYEDFCRVLYSCKVFDGWYTSSLEGEWRVALGTAGGCTNNRSSFPSNPQLLLQAKCTETLSIVLTQFDQLSSDGATLAESLPCGMYVVDANSLLSRAPLQRDIIKASSFSYTRDISLEVEVSAGRPCVLVPCTFDAGMENRFSVRVFSKNGGVSLKAL